MGVLVFAALWRTFVLRGKGRSWKSFKWGYLPVPTSFKILAHKEKPVCVCLWESKPGLLCLQQSLRSAVERGHRLFSFFSPRHTESSCCFLLFMALQLFFKSALRLFLHTSLCQCFPSPRLRNLPHLLLAPLCHGGKSLYCFSRSLSVWSLELCQSVFSRTLEIHSHDSLETLIHTLLKRSSFQWLKGIRHIYGPPISKNIPYIINFFIYKI